MVVFGIVMLGSVAADVCGEGLSEDGEKEEPMKAGLPHILESAALCRHGTPA